MKTYISVFLSSLLLFFSLPFLCTFFFHGPQARTLLEKANCEDFLPYLLSWQTDLHQETESLKAQAVIARTNFVYQESLENSSWDLLKDSFSHLFSVSSWIPLAVLPDRCFEAVRETRDLILTNQGDPCLVPYHQISGGMTRSGEEVFHDSAYSYLQSVESLWDLDSPEYLSRKSFSRSQLPNSLEICQTDSAGYVLSLQADETLLSGESFRSDMDLPSGCFSIQPLDGRTQIVCKGRGHGLGLSQYGANAMASEGSSFEEILSWYFPALTLNTFPS